MAGNDLNNMSPEEILEYQKKNCIFCKIIHKEIPSHEIYSDEKVMIILDINPGSEGHCLVLPKQHYQILPQIPDDLQKYMFVIVKRTSKALLKSLGVEGTSIFIANGALAGQKAPHFMIHVIPRKSGDMLFQLPKHNVEEKQLQEIASVLSMKMGGKIKEQPKQLENKETMASKSETKTNEKSEIDIDKISKLFD